MSVPSDAAPHGPSPRPAPPTAPSRVPLTAIAEVIHRATADHSSDMLVTCDARHDTFDLGFWPIPPEVDHPTEVLVGWRPPAGTDVLGLVTSGEARSDDVIEAVRITVLTATDGRNTTVLERAGGRAETLSEAAQGWGADALRRCLALPTPPPEHGLSVCVEGAWLTAIAATIEASAHGGAPVTWPRIARHHPLQGGPRRGPAPSAPQLRASTTALEAQSSWDRMLALAAEDVAGSFPHPPNGRAVPMREWFDAGSFSRWTARRHADLDDLLFEVLDALPADLASDVLDALVSTTSWTSR